MENLLIMTSFCLVGKHMKIATNDKTGFYDSVMTRLAQVVSQHPIYVSTWSILVD